MKRKIVEPKNQNKGGTKRSTAVGPTASDTLNNPLPSKLAMSSAEVFTGQDFSFLAQNENSRYAASSKRIAHAVIVTDKDGNKTALQFPLPEGSELDSPKVCSITNIEELSWGGLMYRSAKGLDGSSWYSKRYDSAQVTFDEHGPYSVDVAYFSEDDEDLPCEASSWGSANKPETEAELTKPKKIKGGGVLEVDPASVVARDAHRDRGVTQNELMGLSARDAYEQYFKKNKELLAPERSRVMQRAYQADIKRNPENQYRPEWLHARGFSLTPLYINPQNPENLGAAPKWANTEMMVLERIAKWFALKQKSSDRITIDPKFTMLEASELIERIKFEVHIAFQAKSIHFIQDLDVFKERPVFRKATDLAQATGISYGLLHASVPISKEEVRPIAVPEEALSLSKNEIPHFFFNQTKNTKIYQIVPESFPPRISTQAKPSIAAIIDVETTGLDEDNDKITEIGVILVSFTREEGILAVIDSYTGLQDPKQALSAEVIEVTKLTNEQLKGKAIDWDYIANMLKQTDYALCHNSAFDRKFLERNTPKTIQAMFRRLPFGCTLQDINWVEKNCKSGALDYLNRKFGFKFAGHRALNDCWATLNLLRVVDGALSELMSNIEKSAILLCVEQAPFPRKDALKARGFRWSSGNGRLPKSWFAYVPSEQLSEMKQWLNDHINGKKTRVFENGPMTAIDRYSIRAEYLNLSPLQYFQFFGQHPAYVMHDDEDEPTLGLGK